MNDKATAGGYLPASFLDWNGHVTAVIFMSGCNFACPFCHNRDLVLSKTEPSPLSSIIDDIKRRRKFLDGVVLSGGEPCMSAELLPLLSELGTLRLPVKLDTNGSFPDILREVINGMFVDYIAMDVKAPLDEDVYRRVTRSDISVEKIIQSMKLIKESGLQYEFRTTYSPEFLSEDELLRIRKDISDDVHWFAQCFKPNSCLDEKFTSCMAVEPGTLHKLLPGVKVRG